MRQYDNKYFEHYARLVLMNYCDSQYESLEVDERPDLQSESDGIGIEVTQAISEIEGRCNSYVASDYLSHEFKYEEIRSELQNREMLGFDQSEEAQMYHQARDFLQHFSLIRDRIYDKLIKLNKLYRLYPTNGLYIFADTSQLDEVDMNVVVLYIEKIEKHFKRVYDLYFIDCIDKMYQYNTRTREVKLIPIPTDQLKTFKKQAMKNSKYKE